MSPSVVSGASRGAALAAVRPRQWVKNLLVFLAPAGAGVLFDVSSWMRLSLAFVAFCLVSSAAYLENDVRDLASDRLDPRKSSRPVAAGSLSVRSALVLAAFFATSGVLAGFVADRVVAALVVAYAVNASLYSRLLKRVPFVEVACVAFGFGLRFVAGAAAAGVAWSFPLLAMVFCLSCSVLAVKRSAELLEGVSRRRVLGFYRRSSLRVLFALASSGSLLAASVWALSVPGRVAGVFAAVFLAGVFARLFSASGSGDGAEPDRLVFRDPLLAAFLLLWFVSVVLAPLA